MVSGGMSPGVTVGSFTITEDDVRKRKEYLEITAEDERRLRDVHQRLQPHAQEVIDRFYEFLLSHEPTRRFLSEPGLVAHLKQLQLKYFSELTSGNYDLAYCQNRVKVGQAHYRAGLSPEWYLGAYVKYVHIVTDVLGLSFGGDFESFFQTLVSLTKVIYLDTGLALDAYYFAAQEQLRAKNAALEQANEELRKLQRAKQQLTDMIVHDLQNPLAGIVGFLRILRARKDLLDDSICTALDEALRRCDDLSQMIMNVLQVSRAESGKLQLYVENVNLGALVEETSADLRTISQTRTIVTEGPRPMYIRTDAHLVKRIIYNLVRNALRHTPDGTRVVVRWEPVSDGIVRLSVIDDGPGIPPELHPKLFDPFGAPELRQAGLRVDTGLGLAFCRLAARTLGTDVSISSDGKRGTTFSIELHSLP